MKVPLSTIVRFVFLFALFSVQAQTPSEPSKSAVLVDSFRRVPNGDMRGRMDSFLAELANNPRASGVVWVHGTPAEIAGRTRYFQNLIKFRSFDAARIKFLKGRNIGDVRTDLWLVPQGAHEPDVKPEAWIYGELGRVYKRDAVKRIEQFVEEIVQEHDHQGYIINYGSPAEIALRERWISDSVRYRGIDPLRLSIVNGGPGPVRTVMWLVPPGAEYPKP